MTPADADLPGPARRRPPESTQAFPPAATPDTLTPPPVARGVGSQTGTYPVVSHHDDVLTPTLPGYEVVRELGRGGMGVVYEARDLALNRTVAIKMVLHGAVAGPDRLVRFLAEAEALAALQHPNVVQVFSRGHLQGVPYFVMEFCPRGSLAGAVRDRPIAPWAAADLVEQLARGVGAAHFAGIVHRDLKPENVLFAADGTPKVSDLGLAKRLTEDGALGEGLTLSGVVLGTPSYMAPEQARGDTTRTGPAADIYALGAILYRVMTGRPPFLGPTPAETIRQAIEDDPVPPGRFVPGLSRDLSAVCLKCLAKDPRRRYATANDLVGDLGRYLEGHPTLARPPGTVASGLRWARRHRGSFAVLFLVAAAFVLGLVAAAVTAVRATKGEAEAEARADMLVQVLTDAGVAHEREVQRLTEGHQREVDRLTEAVRRPVPGGPGSVIPPLTDIWDSVRGTPVNLGAGAAIVSGAVSPDGARIVTGLADGTAVIWDAKTRGQLVVLRGHTGAVTAVCVSPDGARICTGSTDRTARIWDARTGAAMVTHQGHTMAVSSVAFSADRGRLLTVGLGSGARVWDAGTGKLITALAPPLRGVRYGWFGPNGDLILTSN